MSKLNIGAIEDDKPVTMMTRLPAAVHRDLRAYGEALKREGGHTIDLTRSLLRCWRDLWRLIGCFDEREGKFKLKVDSVQDRVKAICYGGLARQPSIAEPPSSEMQPRRRPLGSGSHDLAEN
jgi:hypothetical protein